jgi:hypothetical protein
MKTLTSLFLCAVVALSFGCDTAERQAREKSARLEREKAERLEREKGETEKLMATLPGLVKARIKLFKTKADELTDALKGIADDRRLAEKALSSVEDRRGLEYTVYNVMTNQDLNALAVKYTGSDFSALRSEFTEAVRFHKTSHTALTQTLQKNAEDYRKQVKDVDLSVDVANQNAQAAVSAAHANITRRIETLEKEKVSVMASLRNRSERNSRIEVIDAQLERLGQLLELSGGSTAHVKATVLESAARRKFDRALDEKESKDTAAISASQFKGDLYNAAQNYRGRSVDRLLNAMTVQAAVLSERLCDLETTLETLEEAEARMRMMEYPDLVKLRETVMSDTRVKLGSALTAPVRGR